MKSERAHAARRGVGVIFPGALGDFICFLPALEALAQTTPIDLFARSEFAELAPRGVRVRSLEHPEVSKLFRPQSNEKSESQSFFQCYDTVFSWLASGNQEFVLRLNAITGGKARVFPFRPAHPVGHQADYYLSCLKHGTARAPQPAIELRHEALTWCDEYWAQQSFPRHAVLTIAPGSGAREKNWPAENFLAVIRWWRETRGGAVILLLGPVEEERGGLEPLFGPCVIASDLPLSRVSALLSRSAVYLGNDSGISHLAAACGVRTVALFGPSDDRQWAPRGEKVVIVRRILGCMACGELWRKSGADHTCLTTLHADEIITILAQLPEVVTLTRCRAGITV